MNFKLNICLFLLNIFLISAQQKLETLDFEKIEKHIVLQENVFIADHIPDNEYIATQEDLNLQLPLLEKTLY